MSEYCGKLLTVVGKLMDGWRMKTEDPSGCPVTSTSATYFSLRSCVRTTRSTSVDSIGCGLTIVSTGKDTIVRTQGVTAGKKETFAQVLLITTFRVSHKKKIEKVTLNV